MSISTAVSIVIRSPLTTPSHQISAALLLLVKRQPPPTLLGAKSVQTQQPSTRLLFFFCRELSFSPSLSGLAELLHAVRSHSGALSVLLQNVPHSDNNQKRKKRCVCVCRLISETKNLYALAKDPILSDGVKLHMGGIIYGGMSDVGIMVRSIRFFF